MGVKVIFLKQLKEAIRALRRNEVLTILADENIEKGVKVDFFSHRISIPAGPFKIAMSTGAMIVPSFSIRSKERKEYQRGIIEPPFRVEKSDPEEDSIKEAADRFIRIVQDYLYHYPDHWLLGEPKIVNGDS
jgi:KDO2-lipid IV(A) lauroyltransferase